MSNNYPDGVTNAMIDRVFGGARDDWPAPLECAHDLELDALWDRLEGEGIEDPDQDPRYIALESQPTTYDENTAQVSSWATSWGAECEWVCPGCGHLNYDAIEKGDL